MSNPKKGETVQFHRMPNGAPLGAPIETVDAEIAKVHRGSKGQILDLVVPVMVAGVPEIRTIEEIERADAPFPNKWTIPEPVTATSSTTDEDHDGGTQEGGSNPDDGADQELDDDQDAEGGAPEDQDASEDGDEEPDA